MIVSIQKPERKDLPKIGDILTRWTEKAEVQKCLQRIKNEIEGKTEFNMRVFGKVAFS